MTSFPNASSSYSSFSLSLCYCFLLVISHFVSSFLSLTFFYNAMNAKSLQSCFLIGHAFPTPEMTCIVTIYRLTSQYNTIIITNITHPTATALILSTGNSKYHTSLIMDPGNSATTVKLLHRWASIPMDTKFLITVPRSVMTVHPASYLMGQGGPTQQG